MFSSFTLGFIAGEGSFSANAHLRDSNRYNVGCACEFTLSVKEKKIVDAIQEQLDIGYTYERSDGVYGFSVTSKPDIEKLVNWIDNNSNKWFEKTQKYDTYQKWRRLALNWIDGLETAEEYKEFVRSARSVNNHRRTREETTTTEDMFEAIERGGTFRCGDTNTTSGKPCQQTVPEPNTRCYSHRNS